MQSRNRTRLRLGALALGISALLFMAFQLFHPVSSLDLSNPDEAAQTFGSSVFVFTDSLLIVAFTLLPFGILTLYAYLAKSHTERWTFVAMILLLAALGPFQAFTGVGAFAFSAASQVYLQGNQGALDVLAALVQGPSVPFGLFGVLLLVLGSIVLALAIWRSGSLPKWAGVMYALGFLLFIVAVSSPSSVQKVFRIVDGLLGGIGGIWLAWSIWRKP